MEIDQGSRKRPDRGKVEKDITLPEGERPIVKNVH